MAHFTTHYDKVDGITNRHKGEQTETQQNREAGKVVSCLANLEVSSLALINNVLRYNAELLLTGKSISANDTSISRCH